MCYAICGEALGLTLERPRDEVMARARNALTGDRSILAVCVSYATILCYYVYICYLDGHDNEHYRRPKDGVPFSVWIYALQVSDLV